MNNLQNWFALCIFTLMIFLYNSNRKVEFFQKQIQERNETIEQLIMEKCKLQDALTKLEMTINCPDCNKTIYVNEFCSCKKKNQ